MRLATFLVALALAGGTAQAQDALVLNDGRRIPLQRAGLLNWQGSGLSGGEMPIFCASNAVVYGFWRGTPIALNGTSMTLGRRGRIEFWDGTLRKIVSTSHSDLAAIGAIIYGADPFVYNAKADEGLKIGQTACKE